MRDSGIGRVLVVSLHQAIADLIPSRLPFYEGWLSTSGLRAGTIGMAPLLAVLSFLRQEGEAYGAVMSLAGEYATEWTVESMSQRRRLMLRAVPRWLRTRLVARVAQRLVRESYQPSRCSAKVRSGTARIEIVPSIFCGVRNPVSHPLCGFYAAAFSKLWALFDLEFGADIVTCRGVGQPSCVVQLAALEGASDRKSQAEGA